MDKKKDTKLTISVSSPADLSAIFSLRHQVYANELKQYSPCQNSSLPDSPDVNCIYIIAKRCNELVGFIAITTPDSSSFSIDKYFNRDEIPISFDKHLYEVRALTVKLLFRKTIAATLLMYAAFRLVEFYEGKNIISIGKIDVLDMYQKLGFKSLDMHVRSGEVLYDLMLGSISEISNHLDNIGSLLARIKNKVIWNMNFTFYQIPECYHGGSFFKSIGEQFDKLDNHYEIISADVLDAWFPPAPNAISEIKKHLPWIMSTSPPTRAEGLVEVIANTRGVSSDCIFTGAGSSALMFLAFQNWLTSSSRVLILDPTYGEYIHILENIIKCDVERIILRKEDGYLINRKVLARKLSECFDLFILVNPNSPTGLHMNRQETEELIEQANCKLIWIDETYVEYAGKDQSLESFAAKHDNVIVCKSMSKVYALSGLRVAYLCSSANNLHQLKSLTPPWSISLPAQIAAINALKANDYYSKRYEETHLLRENLIEGLKKIGITDIVYGIANFILFHLPEKCDVNRFIQLCRKEGLFIRNASEMGTCMEDNAVRIAVKDATTNRRMLNILKNTLAKAI